MSADRVLLGMLQNRYGDRWDIRRTEHLWIATAHDPDCDHAPTLIEPDFEVLVTQLEDPPARSCRPSLMHTSWVAAEMERIGEGCYVSRPPT